MIVCKYLLVTLLLVLCLSLVYNANRLPKRSLEQRVRQYVKTNFSKPKAFTVEKLSDEKFRNCYIGEGGKNNVECKSEPFAVSVDGERFFPQAQQLNPECGQIYAASEAGFKITCSSQTFGCPPGWTFDVAAFRCKPEEVCGPNDAGFIKPVPGGHPRAYVKCKFNSERQVKFCKGNSLYNGLPRQQHVKGVKPCVDYDLCADQTDGYIYSGSPSEREYYECVGGKSVLRTCLGTNTRFSQVYNRCYELSACEVARGSRVGPFKLVTGSNQFTICESSGKRDVHVKCPLGVLVYRLDPSRRDEISLHDQPGAAVMCKSAQHNHIQRIEYFDSWFFKQPIAVYYWSDTIPGQIVCASVVPVKVSVREPEWFARSGAPQLPYGQPPKRNFFDEPVQYSSSVVEVLDEGNAIKTRTDLSQEEALKKYCKSFHVTASFNQFLPQFMWNFRDNICDNAFFRIKDKIYLVSRETGEKHFFGKASQYLNICSSDSLFELNHTGYRYTEVPGDGLVLAYYIPLDTESIKKRRDELAAVYAPLKRKWQRKSEQPELFGYCVSAVRNRSRLTISTEYGLVCVKVKANKEIIFSLSCGNAFTSHSLPNLDETLTCAQTLANTCESKSKQNGEQPAAYLAITNVQSCNRKFTTDPAHTLYWLSKLPVFTVDGKVDKTAFNATFKLKTIDGVDVSRNCQLQASDVVLSSKSVELNVKFFQSESQAQKFNC